MEVVFRTIGVRDRSVDVEAARALGPELRARILREMAQREGVTLDRAATRRAIDFVVQGRSGSAVELGGGLELRRELDRLSVREVDAGVPDAEDRELRIDGAGPGEATVTLGGRTRSVRWWPGRPSGSGTTSGRAHFPTNGLRFPLLVRARRPGDRISLRGGSRPLKKVLMESRVPSLERGRIPVVADAEGRLLWVAGVARAAEPVVVDDENRTMTVEIEE
jgi:tRNA(Ile)-lysidine synthase